MNIERMYVCYFLKCTANCSYNFIIIIIKLLLNTINVVTFLMVMPGANATKLLRQLFKLKLRIK